MSRRRRRTKDVRETPKQGESLEESVTEPSEKKPTVLPARHQQSPVTRGYAPSSQEKFDYRAAAAKPTDPKAIEVQPRTLPAKSTLAAPKASPPETPKATPERRSVPFDDSATEKENKFTKDDLVPVPSPVGDSDWGDDTSTDDLLEEKAVPDLTTTEEEEVEEIQETEDIVAEEPLPETKKAVLPPRKDGEETAAIAKGTAAPANPPVAEVKLRKVLQRIFESLSNLEKASLGILSAALIILGIWTTSSVGAILPESQVTEKPKFPLAGDSVILADLETFWREPIQEGPNRDEGVSSTIELIPAARVTLAKDSKAKALRFLFRDEEGRAAGDVTSLQIEGGRFAELPGNTSLIDGATATIRATTGFLHEGEIISYLSNDDFTWHLVILESADGVSYSEFLTMPISARREENR